MPEDRLDADLLRGVLDALPDAVTLSEAVRDADGRARDLRLRWMNAPALSRRPAGEAALGGLCSRQWPELVDDGAFAACLRVLDSGVPAEGSVELVDSRAFQPGHYEWRAVRVGSDLLLWVLRDVSDRVRAEREAQEAEERWSMVVAGFEQAVLAERRDGLALHENDALLDLLGVAPDDVRSDGAALLWDRLPETASSGSSYAPWAGFGVAAAEVTQYLDDMLDLDLWLVTHVEQDRQTVVAGAGAWADFASPGTTFPWSDSFCIRMVAQGGSTAVPDVRTVPVYAEAATGLLAHVRSYVGVPIAGEDGSLFGTLCGLGGEPRSSDLLRSLHLVELVGRMLSTVRAREEFAQARSAEAAAAYALAERDRLTSTRNRRGWESALADEGARCQRYGSAASVLVVDVDDLKTVNALSGHETGDALLQRCAEVLARVSRPGDVIARLGGSALAVLAVECDVRCASALLPPLRVQLRAAGVAASVGAATRRTGETLTETWGRAETAMRADKRRHGPQPAGASS